MRPYSRSGFTLVEILMVVVILGIVAAVIVPQLGARDDLKASAGARMLIADLSYAQSRAIATQRKQYVQFTGQQYFILSRTSDNAALTQIAHPVNPGNYVISFDSGPLSGVRVIESTFGTSSMVAFDELGSPMQYDSQTNTSTALTSPGIIRIQSGEQIMTITIEPYTGEMTVTQG
jgi:type II secretion system protein H